jgi:hypothetical protein
MPGRRTEFPSSDFAITSVNVGDRLDQREVDDRKRQDEAFYSRRGWGSAIRIGARRLLPYLLLATIIVLAGRWLADQRQALGAKRIAQQLSAALHVPVQVQDTRFQTTPAPAVVLIGVDLGGQVRLDEVTLQFTAPNLWRAVMSGHHRWGDVVISPATINFDQANQLLTWLASLDRAVPDSVTKVRFAELRFAGSRLLHDRYEAATRREPSGEFTTVLIRRLDSPGTMQLQVTPDRAGGPIAFQCDAADWQPPFAPRTAWTEAIAAGHASAKGLEIEKFTLGSAFGAIEGHLAVRQEGPGSTWSANGQIGSVGIDLPTIIQQIAKPEHPSTESDPKHPAGEADQNVATPLSGTASVEAVLAGTGASLEEALERMVAAGEIKVRNAALNGINLGYAATRPSSVSSRNGPIDTASTRFTRLGASFVAGSSGVLLRNIQGVAGALSTRGEITVTPELALDGLLHVNLGGTRVQAPLRIHVRGTVMRPQFGR